MIVECKYVQDERNKKFAGPSCVGPDMRKWMDERVFFYSATLEMMKAILMWFCLLFGLCQSKIPKKEPLDVYTVNAFCLPDAASLKPERSLANATC
jgi:hypothetical protein